MIFERAKKCRNLLVKRAMLAAWVISLFASGAFAQNILRLQHINVEDGLSQSSVYDIMQDSQGFIWLATGDGLDRYDGKDFIVYKSHLNDTGSSYLRDRNINSRIFEDKNNRIWMSTDAGISFFDCRHIRFEIFRNKYMVANDANVIAMDDGLFWAVVPQGGVYAINVNHLAYKVYPFTDKWQLNKEGVNPFSGGAATNDGLWMTDKTGLIFFDKRKLKDERRLMKCQLYGVFALRNGKLLLPTTDGVYLYDPARNTVEFIEVKSPVPGKSLQWGKFAEDNKTHMGYLGAGNDGTICKLDLETHKCEFINFQKSSVNALFVDASQNLWIGTEGNGLFKLDIKHPKFYCFPSGLQPGSTDTGGLMIKSIYSDESGMVWMGSMTSGVITYDRATGRQSKISLPFSPGQHISVITRDSTGRVIVTVGSNVYWLDPLSHKITEQVKLPLILASSPSEPVIYSLAEWAKGKYLVATNLGLYCMGTQRGRTYATMPIPLRFSTTNTWTYCLQQQKDGTLYAGKRSGFMHIRMTSDTTYRVLDSGFAHLTIRHFYKSISTPLLWMATEQGLIAYNETNRQYKIFDEAAGLANSYVYAILPQNDSSLWVSTNQGISNVLVHYGNNMDISARVINYTTKDGLQSSEFNTGAYHLCKDGTMIFGGIAGINWFNPGAITPNMYKAKPVLSAIFVNDSAYAADTAAYLTGLVLPYKRNTISLSFRALEFTNPEQNQFAYQLEGLDKDWVYTANDKVRYSSLPPGNYNFLLKVSNNEGIWNEEPLKISITVLPPYWQTWWFKIIMILFSASVVALIARYYIKEKVRAKTRELEKQHVLNMERLRISKDVHDDLGSGLSKISLMAQMAQKRVTGNEALGNDIKHISAVSKELVDNMRDLIWVLNPENTTLDQLVARLREYCSEYLENLPMELSLRFPHEVPGANISREVQRNVFLTVKEAINNAVKHADACQITVTLELGTDKLTISVTDNGKGFDMAHPGRGGNGLRNMQQRIASIGGGFAIASVPGSTCIKIVMPFEKLMGKNTTLV